MQTIYIYNWKNMKKIHNQKAVVCKTFSLLIPWLCREKCITCAESIGSNKTNLVPNLRLRAKQEKYFILERELQKNKKEENSIKRQHRAITGTDKPVAS